MLFGTHEPQVARNVHAVLAKRGEPSAPADPARGEVWSSIAGHWNESEFENDYISVASTERDKLAKHPWSLGGGGAVELKELLEDVRRSGWRRSSTALASLRSLSRMMSIFDRSARGDESGARMRGFDR
jgi:hypothetical protein